MKKYTYEQIDEHIQWLIEMMDIEYPNNYEIIINSNYAEIRNTQTGMTFLRKDLKMGMNNKMDINKIFKE